jgi:dCTP deaminase
MILSDREIRAAIERGAIAITPVPNESDWTSTAIDLTLDYDIRAWRNPRGKKLIRTIVDPTASKFNLDELLLAHSELFDLHKKPFVIKPHSFVLGWTVEKIRLPHQSRIAARVEGKSSLARFGTRSTCGGANNSRRFWI